MNKLRTGLKQVVKSAVLVAGLAAASGAAATVSNPIGAPDFHALGQTLAGSVFAPDVDFFGLGNNLGVSAYTALFDNVGGTAHGMFTIYAVNSIFTVPNAGDVVGFGSFSGSADSTFSFTSVANKYYFAVVSGSSGAMPASYGVHVSAVPEAETWAMMLVGLGLIGSMIPRQRASSIVSV